MFAWADRCSILGGQYRKNTLRDKQSGALTQILTLTPEDAYGGVYASGLTSTTMLHVQQLSEVI